MLQQTGGPEKVRPGFSPEGGFVLKERTMSAFESQFHGLLAK